MSNELNKVSSRLSLNKLSLNTGNTKCMTLHTQQKNINPVTFLINGKQLENVKFFMFLSIMFDAHLTCVYELRQSARPKIRLPRTGLIFTESCLLYQLIKLINCTQTNNLQILEKIKLILDSTSISQGSTYTYECTMSNCFKC